MEFDSSDERTQHTAHDALMCKYSANKLGYFCDPYLSLFEQQFRSNRKPPIINRGYYARVKLIEGLIERFLAATSSGERQIISLGCGFDTLSYNLIDHHHLNLRVFEVDFPAIIEKKVDFCLGQKAIKTCLLRGDVSVAKDSSTILERTLRQEKESFRTPSGFCVGDLTFVCNDLRNAERVVEKLLAAGAESSTPTLILTECVFVYIDKPAVNSLCSHFATTFRNCSWISYDMINPTDMFGRTMLSNLRLARFDVPGFVDFPNLEAQKQRFLETGWSAATSSTMIALYDSRISSAEKSRIARIEIFDEVEEWQMIMAHYSLTVAVNGELLLSMVEPGETAGGETSGGGGGAKK